MTTRVEVDALIFGGGIAGLWLLDHLVDRGYQAVLAESNALGAGQTVAAQGIIHGGLKYTLDGVFSASAGSIAEMPIVWREALAGTRRPDLRGTRVRSEYCHLWRTDALLSRLGMLGARAGLKVKPHKLERGEWPPALRDCPGDVFRLDEQVIDPVSLVRDLGTQYRARILSYVPDRSRFATTEVVLATTGEELAVRARHVVLTAGAGNADLRRSFGLDTEAMQRRPLHMVLVRGATLPELNGHCTDGAKTRVTITSDRDSAGRTVWQVGGQIAELGVEQDPADLVAHARTELAACLPSFDPAAAELATYRIDRAEAASGGKRPDDISVVVEGSVITAWPTKLALAPRLAIEIEKRLGSPSGLPAVSVAEQLARPDVAPPPWEEARTWFAAS